MTKDVEKAKDDGLFAQMFTTNDIDEAAEIFTREFTRILDKHAPLKTIQNRKNYIPYISEEIKEIMKKRDKLKIEAAKTGLKDKYDEYKTKRK